MQDRYLEDLHTKRAETERELLEADKIADRIAREKAKRKVLATQEKINCLESRYLAMDNLPLLFPDKTDIQIKRMKTSIKEQIRRLTDDKARETYNERSKEHMKHQREDDDDVNDRSKKQGTEEHRLAKITEWERKLAEATTESKKQMAKKRISFFKKTDEERAIIKKKNAERTMKYASKKKDRELQEELDNGAQKPVVVKIKRAKVITEEPVIEKNLADQPADAVIEDNFAELLSDISFDKDIDFGFDFDAAIANTQVGPSNFNLWNSRMQNTNQEPTQNSSQIRKSSLN